VKAARHFAEFAISFRFEILLLQKFNTFLQKIVFSPVYRICELANSRLVSFRIELGKLC
jgi:hypothetical protein